MTLKKQLRISIRTWLKKSRIKDKVKITIFLGRVIRYNCESGLTTPTKYIKQQNFKDKPDLERKKVSEVDREMETIRYAGSQQRQKEKAENKEKKGKKQ